MASVVPPGFLWDAKARPIPAFIIAGLNGYGLPATNIVVVPPEALAHEALARLAGSDPAATCADLGLENGKMGVQRALGHLRESLAQEPRPDAALQLFRQRLHADLPPANGDRRAALMTLMMAQGTARQHLRVPFDRSTLERLV